LNGLTLQKALGNLIDTEICLYLKDCQLVEGFLLDVKPDHIVVDVNKTVFYFPLEHIQTISSNTKSLLVSTEIVHYVNKNYLVDVLRAFRYYWVSINSLSDQGIDGVLSKIADDHVTVINNAELLYIPKSSISNITSHIPEKRIILINKHEQIALQDSQIEERVISEDNLTAKIEVPILEISAEEITGDEIVTNERPEVHPQTRLELYFTLVKLLKYNLSNRDVDNERAKDIIQDLTSHKKDEIIEGITNIEVPISEVSSGKVPEDESVANEKTEDHLKTRFEVYARLIKLLKHNVLKKDEENLIQGFINHSVDEEKEQIDSSVVIIQDCRVETKDMVENPQPINKTKSIKNNEIPILGTLSEENTELKKAAQETPEESSRFVRSDLLECVEEHSLETEHLGVLESAKRFRSERKLLPEESKSKRKKTLLTAWSTLNNEQDPITNPNNFAVENELPDYENEIKQLEGPSDSDNLLVQPVCDQYPNGNFGTLDEKREFPEVTATHVPINPKEVKKILEKQYLSLMKHAETNVFLLAQRRLNQSEEAQYLALQKHAENMYRELKN